MQYILRIIFKIWKYGLFPTFRYNIKKHEYLPQRTKLRSLLIPLIFFSLLFFVFWNEKAKIIELDNVIILYYTYFKVIVSLLLIYTIHIKKMEIASVLGDIETLGESLVEYDINGNTDKVKNNSIAFGVILLFHHIFLVLGDIYLFCRNALPALNIISGDICDLIDYEFIIFYFYCLYLIWSYYNSFVRKMRKNLRTIRTEYELEQLKRIRKNFLTTSENLLKAFNQTILIKNTYDFVSIVFCLYLNIFGATNASFDVFIVNSITQSCWFIWLVGGNLIFLYFNVSVRNKSKLVAEYITIIQENIGRHGLSYKNMERSLLSVKFDDTKLMVCGLFPLEWTFLQLLVAGVTTYLVYLVQFREITDK